MTIILKDIDGIISQITISDLTLQKNPVEVYKNLGFTIIGINY